MAAPSAADGAWKAATREPMGMDPRLEQFRVELIGYCYRMLGSAFEAEDAVQETLVRAWRRLDRFDEDRAPLRSWLYTIATNVCLDMLRSAQRRARAMDLGPSSSAGASLGVPLPDTTVASVTSALQRARATLAARKIEPAEPFRPMDKAQQQLLARYCDAFERYDVQTLVSLLHEDATMSMPPFAWWLRGRGEIRRALLGAGRPCDGARLVPTVANGSPAFGQYRPSGPAGGYEPFALVVILVSDGLITETTTYLDAKRLFPLFGLPRICPPEPGP